MAASVRLAQREFAAPQAAPHLTQPGGPAEPGGKILLVGRIRGVSRERAGDQLPPVMAGICGILAIFAHGPPFNQNRVNQNRGLLRGRWAVELAAPSSAVSSAIGISSR